MSTEDSPPEVPRPERPRPEYGEYAPDSEDPTPDREDTMPDAQASSAPTSAQVEGVPHNLGIGPSTPPPPPAPGLASGPPVAGPPPQAPPPAGPAQPPPAEWSGGAPREHSRLGDRIVTIVLLVLGAIGALNLGTTMLTLGTQLHLFADVAGLEGFTVPPAVGTLQTVGALTILSLYAITLLWSIHRMRTHKLAFWVPLTGGAVAFVTTVIMSMIAMFLVPELITNITPDQIMQLFEDQMGTPTN